MTFHPHVSYIIENWIKMAKVKQIEGQVHIISIAKQDLSLLQM